MESNVDIEWHGLLRYAPPLRKLTLQSLVERIVVRRFPNPGSFSYWRLFIEFKLKLFGVAVTLELGTNIHKLTCKRAKQGVISGDPQLTLPGPQNRPYQITVERVLEIAADFRKKLYVTSSMNEQQLQAEWAPWMVGLVMELGENEPIAAYHRAI